LREKIPEIVPAPEKEKHTSKRLFNHELVAGQTGENGKEGQSSSSGAW